MNGTQLIELVLIESGHGGEELFVLEWEYDGSNDKIIYLKFFPLRSWKNGHRDHPQYITPKGESILYARDESGYINTSKRLTSSTENGRWYDEYGRAYIKSDINLSLSEARLKLFHLQLLERLEEAEIIRRMKEEDTFLNLNGLGEQEPDPEL